MAVLVKDVFAGLLALVAQYTETSTIKGFPDWKRTTVSLPTTALELASAAPPPANRIGVKHARQELGLRIYAFTRNEPELCEFVQLLLDLFRELGSMTLESQRVDLTFQGGDRYVPETGVQQERHAFVIQVNAAWSVRSEA